MNLRIWALALLCVFDKGFPSVSDYLAELPVQKSDYASISAAMRRFDSMHLSATYLSESWSFIGAALHGWTRTVERSPAERAIGAYVAEFNDAMHGHSQTAMALCQNIAESAKMHGGENHGLHASLYGYSIGYYTNTVAVVDAPDPLDAIISAYVYCANSFHLELQLEIRVELRVDLADSGRSVRVRLIGDKIEYGAMRNAIRSILAKLHMGIRPTTRRSLAQKLQAMDAAVRRLEAMVRFDMVNELAKYENASTTTDPLAKITGYFDRQLRAIGDAVREMNDTFPLDRRVLREDMDTYATDLALRLHWHTEYARIWTEYADNCIRGYSGALSRLIGSATTGVLAVPRAVITGVFVELADQAVLAARIWGPWIAVSCVLAAALVGGLATTARVCFCVACLPGYLLVWAYRSVYRAAPRRVRESIGVN